LPTLLSADRGSDSIGITRIIQTGTNEEASGCV
jgi:hypothetical protein